MAALLRRNPFIGCAGGGIFLLPLALLLKCLRRNAAAMKNYSWKNLKSFYFLVCFFNSAICFCSSVISVFNSFTEFINTGTNSA
ncbi:MAG: hypothetical protein RLZZ316_908 [Bacteroidota bacterium]